MNQGINKKAMTVVHTTLVGMAAPLPFLPPPTAAMPRLLAMTAITGGHLRKTVDDAETNLVDDKMFEKPAILILQTCNGVNKAFIMMV